MTCIQNKCLCGHLRQDHHVALPPPRVYRARGGLPDRHCMQFISANGQRVCTIYLIFAIKFIDICRLLMSGSYAAAEDLIFLTFRTTAVFSPLLNPG
jgi:hypothetical protein